MLLSRWLSCRVNGGYPMMYLCSCSKGSHHLIVYSHIAGANGDFGARNLGLNHLLAFLKLGERARRNRHVGTSLEMADNEQKGFD